MVDVAGLVPGAHEGRGMGNQFLSDLADADALIHVVDYSGKMDAEGNPGKGDPEADIKFLEDEIEQWIKGILEKNWTTLNRKVGVHTMKLSEAVHAQLSGLNMTEEKVSEAIKATGFEQSGDLLALAREIRKRSKPIIIAANKMDDKQAQENYAHLKKGTPCCAEAELALRRAAEKGLIEYSPGDKDFKVLKPLAEPQAKALEFIRKNVLEKLGGTGVQGVVDEAAYKLLDCIVAYPVEDEGKLSDRKGNVLPHAYLMPRGSTALDLAFKVHTDIGKGFIGAIDARTKKRVGKEYELKDGDVIRILV
jgi:ribosome-binding ATPase YchF (GTP1/OBG family)